MPRPMGRPPKTIEEKLRTGNPGRRKLPERGSLTVLPGASEPPEPDRPLMRPGLELWNRVWKSPASAWFASGVDNELILMLCERMDERAKLRLEVLRDGDRLQRVALRQLDAQIQSDLIELGMTPVARARLGVAEVKHGHSAVDDFFGSP